MYLISYICNKIDNYREDIYGKFNLNLNNKLNIKKLKILHVTNFNERHNGRLFYNTGKRINNGFVRFMHGQLVVRISDFEALKKATIKVLDFYGYFAAEMIWDFAVGCNKSLMISFVLAMEGHEITDEFDRMINHTNDIDKEHILLDAEINKNDYK